MIIKIKNIEIKILIPIIKINSDLIIKHMKNSLKKNQHWNIIMRDKDKEDNQEKFLLKEVDIINKM